MKQQPGFKNENFHPILSVNKDDSGKNMIIDNTSDVVFQTDLNFNISGWNKTAEQLHGISKAMGRNIFEVIQIDFADTNFESAKKELEENGIWKGRVVYKMLNGEKIHFLSIASFMRNEKNEKQSIVFFNHNITYQRNTELKLAEAETTYEKLLNTLVDGVMMIGTDNRINACNKRAAEILGLQKEKILGRLLNHPDWNAIKADGSDFPFSEFPAVVSLQTGFPQRNVKMGLHRTNGELIWLSVNSEALIRPDEFEPYAVVASFSDITEMIDKEEELRKSNERFYYVSKISTDAIWDLDLITNEIYRSEAFQELSGYAQDDIKPDLNWWFEKIHPDERERVKNNLNINILNGHEHWEDEYSFLCADGEYRILIDIGIILYQNGKPVRILGAIRDLTEKKKLEQHLLDEQEQKRKSIEKATISAQEKERANISNELHDNVNQILMSSKMCLDSARLDPGNNKELFEKAIQFQNLAIHEIRKLSHKLSTSVIKVIGLKKSVNDIVQNLNSLHGINSSFKFDDQLEDVLTYEQKLMIYRIVQEQTNNIVKHAHADNASISLIEKKDQILLRITDNGEGFETGKQSNGIGFINISSRVEAFGGKSTLTSSTGKGCVLDIRFPLLLN